MPRYNGLSLNIEKGNVLGLTRVVDIVAAYTECDVLVLSGVSGWKKNNRGDETCIA
jgi:hypothetical protein